MKSASLVALLPAVVLGLFSFSPQRSATGASENAARLNNLGVAYMNQQSFEKAFKSFQDAAAADPKLATALVNQGIALLALGKVDAAKPLLEEAVRQGPKDLHAWYNLGLLHKNSATPGAAIEAFRHVLDVDPNDANTWYFLGAVYAQDRQFPEAISAFQHALKLDPFHASAEFGLSRAYQQSGDQAQAREHLKTFQHITQAKIGTPMGLAYGDQGQYSLAEESPLVFEKALPQIPVKFVDVTDKAGIVSKAAPGDATTMGAYLGPGACFLDYDGDRKLDIFLPGSGPQGGFGLYRGIGGGKFEEVTKKAGLDPTEHGISCTAGDYDNDGYVDLVVTVLDGRVVLLHNEKNGTFKDVTSAAGIRDQVTDPANSNSHAGVTFIDYDHDGDLDIYVMPRQRPRKPPSEFGGPVGQEFPNTMWRNNGNGTFEDVTEQVGLAGPAASANSVGTDYNNDRAVDLVFTRWKEGPAIYENPREGKFPLRGLWSSSIADITMGVAVLDFNHDAWMDLAFAQWAAPGLTLWRNNRGKDFVQVPLPTGDLDRAFGVAAIDYDNDGWTDLIVAGENKDQKGEVRLLRNLGPEGFKDVTSDVGLDQMKFQHPRSIITGDFDEDGATDVLITQSQGPAVLLRNEGGNKNHWLRLSLKGLNDNKSAIGTKVEVFSGGNRQKFEIAGSNGYLGQNSTDLVIGLGQANDAEIVRMLWPSGVVQDEVAVAGLKDQPFTQMDRRGSSCPTLFAWNGDHYELVADVLGAGVIGHWVAPGERNVARPTEYVKVDRNLLREKDGKLSFRLLEPMEEVVYLDEAKLLAVDHPADFEVYPNEYFAGAPPFPEFKVVASRNAQPPKAAIDDQGRNLLPDLLAHRYVGELQLTPFKGFTRLHALELDLGAAYNGGPLWLLLRGEIEYFTATGMYAADQAGIHAVAPYVEAYDAKGKWVRVLNDMGFPAGGPRTMTANLAGKLPHGTERIRIWTNLQIYWDSILIDRTPQGQKVRLTALTLEGAKLQSHGYPRQIEAWPPGNVKYIYEEVSRTGPYARQAGAYTRFGDVRPLLREPDDRFAIFGSGEEVALEFNPRSLPALPEGWVRDYFFRASGYEKDMDFYAADGSTVGPLPFRRMGTYPYNPKLSFPSDNAHLNYMLDFNSRHVSGNEPGAYRFNYPRPGWAAK